MSNPNALSTPIHSLRDKIAELKSLLDDGLISQVVYDDSVKSLIAVHVSPPSISITNVQTNNNAAPTTPATPVVQTRLSDFGVHETVKFGTKTFSVRPESDSVVPVVACEYKQCKKTFKNAQGASSHAQHCSFKPKSEKSSTNSLASLWAKAPLRPARDVRLPADNDEVVSIPDDPTLPVSAPQSSASVKVGRRGGQHRRAYSLRTKLNVIDWLDENEARMQQRHNMEHVFRVASVVHGVKGTSSIKKWYGKEREKLEVAAKDHSDRRMRATYRLNPVAQSARLQWPLVEETLRSSIRKMRVDGQRVTAAFFKMEAAALVRSAYADDLNASSWLPDAMWLKRFASRNNFSQRRRTNNHQQSLVDRLPIVRHFHYLLGKEMETSCVPLCLRFNMDEVPVSFGTDKGDVTYEEKGSSSVWLPAMPGGDQRRLATLMPLLRLDGTFPQPRLAIIFRGKGLRITDIERKAYHPDVDVYFQEKAWCDDNIMREWTARTYIPAIGGTISEVANATDVVVASCAENEARFVAPKLLFLDNLASHQSDDVKQLLKQAYTKPWYYPPNLTDELQPVDANVGVTLKNIMKRRFYEWLQLDTNRTRWLSAQVTASERRVLLSQLAGEAWTEIAEKRMPVIQRAAARTGNDITSRSDTERVVLSGIVDGTYAVCDEDAQLSAELLERYRPKRKRKVTHANTVPARRKKAKATGGNSDVSRVRPPPTVSGENARAAVTSTTVSAAVDTTLMNDDDDDDDVSTDSEASRDGNIDDDDASLTCDDDDDAILCAPETDVQWDEEAVVPKHIEVSRLRAMELRERDAAHLCIAPRGYRLVPVEEVCEEMQLAGGWSERAQIAEKDVLHQRIAYKLSLGGRRAGFNWVTAKVVSPLDKHPDNFLVKFDQGQSLGKHSPLQSVPVSLKTRNYGVDSAWVLLKKLQPDDYSVIQINAASRNAP